MKKALFFVLLLLVPFIVHAEVAITNVEVENKTPGLEVEDNPSFEGLKLNLNLKFDDIGDFVKYKVTVKNDTNKEYEIESGESLKNDEYIKYVVESNDKVLKAGKEQIIYITASYTKEVPITAFTDGKYIEKKDTSITLVNNEKESNPNTAIGYLILPAAIIMFVSLLITLINKHKLDRLSPFVLALAVSIPLSIMAIEKLTIEVEAQIEIATPERELTYVYECVGGSNGFSGIDSLKYKKGMTWNEFINSDYFLNAKDEYKNTLITLESVYFVAQGNNCLENGLPVENFRSCLNNYEGTETLLTDLIKPNNEGIYYYNYCK